MNDSDLHLKLLANVPIHIDGIGQFQLPTIREIIEMGESVHQYYLNMLLFSKESIPGLSDEAKEFSDFELMIKLAQQEESFWELLRESFRLFLNSEPKKFENGSIYFDELVEENFLTEEKWDYIKKIARLGNFIQEQKEEEYVAGNERARKFLEEQKKRKAMIAKLKNKVEKMNLHSILSGVAWRTDGIDSLLNKTTYQLYDGFYRLGFVDNYHQVFTGIYTGNVDSSKIKLPDINWANVIKINYTEN